MSRIAHLSGTLKQETRMGDRMATPDVAKETTTSFLKAEIRRYYEAMKPTLPDRFGRREFGFMFWTAGIVQRHIGFSKEEELRAFLPSRIPAHAYYSSAYYEKPAAPTMEEKGWLGADLIFDLDADHLPGAKHMEYPDMLEAVRHGIIKLWDQFLATDFGFDERSMRLVFSGGRGYHIHVFDEHILSLGSHERREIVDYITGKGLSTDLIFQERPYDMSEFRGRVRVKKRMEGPRPSQPGWRGKISRGILELTLRLERLSREEAIDWLSAFPGMDRKLATTLYDSLFGPLPPRSDMPRRVDKVRKGEVTLIRDGPSTQSQALWSGETLSDKERDAIIGIAIAMEQVPLDDRLGVSPREIWLRAQTRQRCETDEPVTSDVKRLIRMPSSLHGKTGLQVIPLSRDALDEFRPLRDAVPQAWTDDAVRMNLKNKINMEIRGDVFNLAPGVNDVPQYLAIFLAARGLATVVPEA